MYGCPWRVLPGPVRLRVPLLVLLAEVMIAICFTWVFPAVAPWMPLNDITVE